MIGFTVFSVWSAAMVDFNNYLPSEQVTAASGIWVAFLNIGGFLASFYTGAVASITGNSSPRLPLLIGVFISSAIFVAWMIGKVTLDRKYVK
jgi:hypothetical protein